MKKFNYKDFEEVARKDVGDKTIVDFACPYASSTCSTHIQLQSDQVSRYKASRARDHLLCCNGVKADGSRAVDDPRVQDARSAPGGKRAVRTDVNSSTTVVVCNDASHANLQEQINVIAQRVERLETTGRNALGWMALRFDELSVGNAEQRTRIAVQKQLENKEELMHMIQTKRTRETEENAMLRQQLGERDVLIKALQAHIETLRHQQEYAVPVDVPEQQQLPIPAASSADDHQPSGQLLQMMLRADRATRFIRDTDQDYGMREDDATQYGENDRFADQVSRYADT